MPGEIADYSIGEVTTHAKLAIRGLGYSWGVAEDAGRAVAWLEQYDLPGMATLASLCQQIDSSRQERNQDNPDKGSLESTYCPQSLQRQSRKIEWIARDGTLCPILTGIALSDAGPLLTRVSNLTAKQVMHPLLLVPFTAELATLSNTLVHLTSDDLTSTTDSNTLWITPPFPALADTLTIAIKSLNEVPPQEPWQPRRQRASIAADVWSDLDHFARRTYAPATDESRVRGAGAGLSDND